jgi:light-regulated signal transduction histidine kinase (bacteriophytochrome)
MSTGQPVLDEEFVGETAKAQGETRYWSESWYPVRAAEGENVGVGVVVVETTAQRRSTADMQASNEALRRSNEELQRFAYAVAHDLQEPLRSVQALSELLEQRHSRDLAPAPIELLRLIRDGASRMSHMVSDLLKYSTVAAQTARPDQPIDSARMLQAALANLQQCMHDSGATVTSDTLPPVIADEQLTQVFQNLIGNAIKYRGKDSPHVHVSARRRGGDWVFSVKDNGIGFDMKYADKIFGVFHRLHGRDKFEGSGVGLAITKHIVERHGGRIWVKSEPNRGSTFFFTLPAASAEASGLQQAAE